MAIVVAMAGGGLVFRLLQVQISCEKAWRRSILSFTNSHWKLKGFSGVLAAWNKERSWVQSNLPATLDSSKPNIKNAQEKDALEQNMNRVSCLFPLKHQITAAQQHNSYWFIQHLHCAGIVGTWRWVRAWGDMHGAHGKLHLFNGGLEHPRIWTSVAFWMS